ncbi:ATP-binding protein, partial [Streptomyces venezuelae]|uniref:ATP-binding protein n=1 Tax=Streptomyces venezuelae TaxID=54571 RepID=UPI003F879A7A
GGGGASAGWPAGPAGGRGPGPGDVCFVELAPLRDGAALPQTLLGALGLRENGLDMGAGARSPADRLVAALSDRMLLLVLDNCEHVVDEVAALVARLLSVCPRLRVLATSREPLGITGENLWQVRPLDGNAAVFLFTDRARAARRGFTADQRVVGRICAALDNLPLAIELAAARVRTLDVADLAARLHDRLGVGARGSRTADERHRTLRGVVAWSWDLLSAEERRAARRFTVFAGGATPEAATRVCATDDETLESLVDKSLLEVAGGRYRMLATIAAYASEQLDAPGHESTTAAPAHGERAPGAGITAEPTPGERVSAVGPAGRPLTERDSAELAHGQWLLELLRAADPHLRRAEQLAWLPVLATEHGNLLAAVRRTVDAPDTQAGLRLLAAASTYLWIRGAPASVAPSAVALLDRLDGEPSPELGEEYVLCVLLAASGAAGRPVWQRHRASAEKALAAAWADGRTGRHPVALLLWMLRSAGEADPRSAFALVSSLHDSAEPWARATARYVSGFGPLGEGDTERAERAFGTAVEGFRALGDRWGTALALDALAGLAGGRGDLARATALTDEALALTERIGALEDSADLLVNRGDQRIGRDAAAARADYER